MGGTRFDTALITAHSSVPGCVAAAVVDRRSGEVIAAHPVDLRHAVTTVLDTVDLLDQDTNGVEAVVGGGDGEQALQEIVVDRDNHLVAVVASPRIRSVLLLLVCQASSQVGLLLARARSALPFIEAAYQTQAKETAPWSIKNTR